MHNQDVLHLILPGLCDGQIVEFRDFFGRCDVRMDGRFTMTLAGELPAALVRFDVELKAGRFDYDTLYCEMAEYPSGEFVRTSPWDAAMDPPPRMQVPVLDVHLDGELYGKMWFEMPSPQEIKQRKLGGVFALPFGSSGRHEIRIEVPAEDRHRLDFAMVNRITVRLDDREIPSVSPRTGWDPRRPWLFLGGRSLEQLQRVKESAGRETWQDMARTVDHFYTQGTSIHRGVPSLATAAFMAMVEPAEGHLERLVSLLEARRTRDAFLESRGRFMYIESDTGLFAPENRWIMGHGWNDYGFSWILLDYCCIYQWLGDRLPEPLREWIGRELIEYGRCLYRFIVFQRQYSGGQGYYESHSIVPLLTVAALAATLYEQCPEAGTWLNFAVGRIRRATRVAPTDGRAPMFAWGPLWLAQSIGLLRDLIGEDHRRIPYFQALPTALWRTHHLRRAKEQTGLRSFYRLLLSAYCASELNDPEAQRYYQLLYGELKALAPDFLAACYLNVLWHSRAAGTAPDEQALERSWLFSDVGTALLQTNYDCPRFAMRVQSGPANGRSSAYLLESFASAPMAVPANHGGYEIWLAGRPVVQNLFSYNKSFKHGNFVTVDGDGFYMDGAYLPGRVDRSTAAFLRRSEIRDDYCYLDAFNTPSYRPELQITMSRRQVFFDVRGEWVVIVDDLASPDGHEYASLIHAPRIESVGEGSFECFGDRTRGQEPVGPLHVRCLGGQSVQYEVSVASSVRSYQDGVTIVKGAGTLHGDGRGGDQRPALLKRIACKAAGRRTTVRFITAASPHSLSCELSQDTVTVATRLGRRRLRLRPLGLEWDGQRSG